MTRTPNSIALYLFFLCVAGCGTARQQVARAPVSAASVAGESRASEGAPSGFSDVNTDRALTTRTYLRVWSPDLLDTASKLRQHIYSISGFVVAEQIDYEDPIRAYRPRLPKRAPRRQQRTAVFSVRVPIDELPGVLDWLRFNTRVIEQYVQANRVGAARNHVTAVIGTDAATPAQPQMTSVDIYLETEESQVRFKAARMIPTVRATTLITSLLQDSEDRRALVGVALGVALPALNPGGLVPSPLFEVAGYPETSEHPSAVVATVGVARYSRSGRDGASRSLNPFAGARVGYAHAGDHALVVAGEIGLELIKASGVTLSTSLRPQGMIGSESRVALEAGATLGVAF